jgi:hypothetical protein
MRNRGRRLIHPENHSDKFGIIALDAQLRFAPLRGVRVRERQAAFLAAAASMLDGFHHTGPVLFQSPPPTERAGINLRRSPSQKAFAQGYIEWEVFHVKTPKLTMKYLQAAADRIRKGRAIWRRRPQAREWLSYHSYQLAIFLYPKVTPALLSAEHEKTK